MDRMDRIVSHSNVHSVHIVHTVYIFEDTGDSIS